MKKNGNDFNLLKRIKQLVIVISYLKYKWNKYNFCTILKWDNIQNYLSHYVEWENSKLFYLKMIILLFLIINIQWHEINFIKLWTTVSKMVKSYNRVSFIIKSKIVSNECLIENSLDYLNKIENGRNFINNAYIGEWKQFVFLYNTWFYFIKSV